jgi:hypothetical protein
MSSKKSPSCDGANTDAPRPKKQCVKVEPRKIIREVVLTAPFHFDPCDREIGISTLVDHMSNPEFSRVLRNIFEDEETEAEKNHQSDEDAAEESDGDSDETQENNSEYDSEDEGDFDDFDELLSHMEPMPKKEREQRRKEFERERQKSLQEKREQQQERKLDRKTKNKETKKSNDDNKKSKTGDATIAWKQSLVPFPSWPKHYWIVRMYTDGIAMRFLDRVKAQLWIWDNVQSHIPTLKPSTQMGEISKELGDHCCECFLDVALSTETDDEEVPEYGPYGVCIAFEPLSYFMDMISLQPISDSLPAYYPCLPFGCGPFETSLMETIETNDKNVEHPLDNKQSWRATFGTVTYQVQQSLDGKVDQADDQTRATYYEEKYNLDYLEELVTIVRADKSFRECLEATGANTPLYYVDTFCFHQEALLWEKQRARWLNVAFTPFMTTLYDYNIKEPIAAKFIDLRTMRTWGLTQEDKDALANVTPDWKVLIDPKEKHPLTWSHYCTHCQDVVLGFRSFEEVRKDGKTATWLEARDMLLQHYTECRGHGHPDIGLLQCFEHGSSWFEDWFSQCCIQVDTQRRSLARVINMRHIQILVISTQGGYKQILYPEPIDSSSDSEEEREDTDAK